MDKRLSSRQRGYDSTWEKVRALKLKDQPLCEVCQKRNRITAAVLVHHVDSNPRNNADQNLMSVCRHCHDVLHSKIKGCDARGLPIDPLHPWNMGGA